MTNLGPITRALLLHPSKVWSSKQATTAAPTSSRILAVAVVLVPDASVRLADPAVVLVVALLVVDRLGILRLAAVTHLDPPVPTVQRHHAEVVVLVVLLVALLVVDRLGILGLVAVLGLLPAETGTP